MKTNQEIAVIGAEWWAKQMVAPKLDSGLTPKGSYMKVQFLSRIHPVTAQKKEKFISFLVGKFKEYLDNGANSYFPICVDYGPEEVLAEACAFAEIPQENLPLKTSMSLQLGYVGVMHFGGKEGKWEILYSTKPYWGKAIAARKKYMKENLMQLKNSPISEQAVRDADWIASDCLKAIKAFETNLIIAEEG